LDFVAVGKKNLITVIMDLVVGKTI